MITSQEISLLGLILVIFGFMGGCLIILYIQLGKKSSWTAKDYDTIELAEYNRRSSLGIIHSKTYMCKMKKLQKKFDDVQAHDHAPSDK